MPNTYFQFKQFRIDQENCAMKVCTDACIMGAWYASKLSGVNSVLDIGSGTGLLMMMLAQQSDAVIHGIEIQPDCYQQLKENISQNSWARRMQVFNGDVRGYAFPLQYDFIISNPPFYENDLLTDVENRQLAMHSKALNLDELLEVVITNLSRSGMAGIMLPFHRSSVFVKLAEKRGLYLYEELRVKQTPRHNWFRSIMSFRFSKEVVSVKEMIINSSEFKELMKGYYLY